MSKAPNKSLDRAGKEGIFALSLIIAYNMSNIEPDILLLL
jgi:hypothetical protein